MTNDLPTAIMKILLFFLLCLASINSRAQELRRHEVGICVGSGPNDADMKLYHMLDILKDRYQLEEDYTISGPFCMIHHTISVDYLYHLSHRWAIGGLFGWAYANGDVSQNGYDDLSEQPTPPSPDNSRSFREGHLISRSFYVLPFARYSWYVTDNQVFRCYSKIALGFMRQVNDFRPETDREGRLVGGMQPIFRTDRKLTFQFTLGGIEFGNQRIRLYSECGYGCQGMFNVGMKVAL